MLDLIGEITFTITRNIIPNFSKAAILDKMLFGNENRILQKIAKK